MYLSLKFTKLLWLPLPRTAGRYLRQTHVRSMVSVYADWLQMVPICSERWCTEGQPKLTAIIQLLRLTLFWHIKCMDDNADAKRILFSPPADWRRHPDVDVWHYAILELHARNDDDDVVTRWRLCDHSFCPSVCHSESWITEQLMSWFHWNLVLWLGLSVRRTY